MPTEKLKLIPLGGLGEIGMNCLVLEYAGQMVLIDCGIQFPDASYPGVDILVPDFKYVTDRLDSLLGIVVTHGHDDHIGAIPLLARHRDVDVWATPFPQGLLKHKLSEAKGVEEVRFHDISPREKFTVGPFTFDPIPVAHSIIEALGFAIETPVGVVVHSGDFKHDPIESHGQSITLAPFQEYGDKGVLLLLSDSTNAERTGHTLSETDITKSFETILSAQTGRIIVALFASNIRRIERILHVAKSLGKKVAFAGRSMHNYTRLAHEQGSLDIPSDTLVLIEDIQRYDDKDVIVMSTGSQAEPQSALLRIAQGIHKDFEIKEGDMIVMSSRFIPGNEKAISSMIDHLYRSGAEVLYESIHQIHVSGHGFQDELMMLLQATRPKLFIPVHGEYRHLAKHAKLARRSGVKDSDAVVIEDGQIVTVDASGIHLGEKLALTKTAVVDGHFMDSAPAVFAQRYNLAKTGIVFAAVLRDKKTGRPVYEPTISTYGLLYREGESQRDAVLDAQEMLDELCDVERNRDDLPELVRIELRRFFRKRVSHKPVVIPLLLDI